MGVIMFIQHSVTNRTNTVNRAIGVFGIVRAVACRRVYHFRANGTRLRVFTIRVRAGIVRREAAFLAAAIITIVPVMCAVCSPS